jgi:hypothetical protein
MNNNKKRRDIKSKDINTVDKIMMESRKDPVSIIVYLLT